MKSHARVTRTLIGLLMASVLAVVGAQAAQAGLTTAATVSNAPKTATVTAAPGFYAGGTWQLYQSNGPIVTLNVTQKHKGGKLSGKLSGTVSTDNGTPGTIEEGSVDGMSIFFTIPWSDQYEGRYTGTLGPDRRLSGTTFDLHHPSTQATWFTTHVF